MLLVNDLIFKNRKLKFSTVCEDNNVENRVNEGYRYLLVSFSCLCVIEKDVESVFEILKVLASADKADEVHDSRRPVFLRNVSNLLKFLSLYWLCNVHNECILVLIITLVMMCDNDDVVINLFSAQALISYCRFFMNVFMNVAAIMKLMMLIMLITLELTKAESSSRSILVITLTLALRLPLILVLIRNFFSPSDKSQLCRCGDVEANPGPRPGGQQRQLGPARQGEQDEHGEHDGLDMDRGRIGNVNPKC